MRNRANPKVSRLSRKRQTKCDKSGCLLANVNDVDPKSVKQKNTEDLRSVFCVGVEGFEPPALCL